MFQSAIPPTDIHLFADDTSLMDILDNYLNSYAKINRDLHRLSSWANKWLVTFNAKKTVFLQITRKVNPAPKPLLKLNGETIKEVVTHKHLGLTFNTTLTWSDHISQLVTKSSRCIGLLKRISRDVPRNCLEILYKSMIRPLLEYADIIFDGSSDTILKRLEDTQRQAALACTGAYRHTSHNKLLSELGWPPLSTRCKQHRLNVMFKLQNGLTPAYLESICPPLTCGRTPYNLRTGQNVSIPQQRTATYQNSFIPQSIKDWNELDNPLRQAVSIDSFKEKLKHLIGFKTNKLFHHDSSKAAINLTRIRLGLSGLSSQRHDYNHIDTPVCPTCGAKSEDPLHFFLLCPTFEGPRPTLLHGICEILFRNNFDVDFRKRTFRKFLMETMLRGSILLSESGNLQIMKCSESFIRASQRFP